MGRNIPTPTDHLAAAKRLRDRAKECRTLSGMAADAQSRESYLKLAESYEALAIQEERAARSRD